MTEFAKFATFDRSTTNKSTQMTIDYNNDQWSHFYHVQWINDRVIEETNAIHKNDQQNESLSWHEALMGRYL